VLPATTLAEALKKPVSWPLQPKETPIKNVSPGLDPLKADFRNFLYLVWRHLDLASPTPIQYDIAQWLQGGPRRQITMAFRGVGKSWETVAYVLWRLYCDPQIKILVISASAKAAADFSTFALDLINDMSELAHLRPRSSQRQSKLSFDVGPARPDKSPSVLSLGITSQITGTRADLIVADDIEVTNNSDTSAKREKLKEQVKEFDAILKPGGQVVYLGTPQTEQSIYIDLQKAGYIIRVWPARYPRPDKLEKMRAVLAPIIVQALDADPALEWTPTDSARFHNDDLLERELSFGKAGFALQFQLDTTLSDAERYPLKLRDLLVHPLDTRLAPVDFMWAASAEQLLDLDPVGLPGDRYFRPGYVSKDASPYEGAVMFVDPSGRGSDETAYAVVKHLHGRLFLTAAGGTTAGYEKATLQRLIRVAKAQSVNLILVEPNYGGGMFSSMLRAEAASSYAVAVEDASWSSTAKEARIVDTLEPVLAQHRLVVCPTVIEDDLRSTEAYDTEQAGDYRLMYQLTRLTRDRGALRKDDRVDALAGAVAYWVDAMNRNTSKAAQDHAEAMLEEMCREYVAHFSSVRSGPKEGPAAKRPLSHSLKRIRAA